MIDHVSDLKLQYLVELSKLGNRCAVMEADVAQWLADAGFVYATDVTPVADRVLAFELPDDAQPPIEYQVAVVADSNDADAAEEFVETLLGVQFYAPDNPRPYDDTGWAISLVRNVKVTAVADKSIQQQPMALASADFKVAGTIAGTGPVLIVDHTTDNTLVTFRFRHAAVKMSAAEQAFEAGGHRFAPGAFVIQNADRAALVT